MILQIALFLFIILFFTGNLIYLLRLMKENIKNKKAVKKARICLEKIQRAKDQIFFI